jgi:hypothetical protein
MKKYINYLCLFFVTMLVITACEKKGFIYDKPDALPDYSAAGIVNTITASASTVAGSTATDATTVETFTWTSPNFSIDTSTIKYVVLIDSTSRNFSKAASFTVTGTHSLSLTGQSLNNLLIAWGVRLGTSATLDVKVISAYPNNNNAVQSNTIKITASPYSFPITLVPSSTNAITLLVSNATNTAISFNWNSSPFGATNIINYALQLDTVGGNFTNPQVIKYGTALTSSISVTDLNSIAIAAGVIGGSTKKVEFRIVSYVGTTYTTPIVYSNAVTISITTFTPVPPTLYIVGDATPGGWSNPVPLPSQQFTRLDAVSFGIVVNLTAGKSYLLLPLNGDWTHKYGGASATGGALLADNAVPGSNTPAPATTGTYQIVVNFQTGTYTVTPFTTTIPPVLFIIGDATPLGWNNNSGLSPTQQFTRIDAVSYGIVVNLTAGKSYVFLPEDQGLWAHKFGGTSATGGTLLADGAVPGSNTPAPATTGNYEIIVNFQTGTYTVTPYTGVLPVPTNLFIVGDATPGGWNNPVPTPSQQFTRVNLTDFQLTVNLSSAGSYLFLPVNGDWGHKYGGASATGGSILYDGAVPGSNTPAPAVAGNYLIDVDFAAGKYTVTKQ